jgi:hypothetical protein
MAQAFKQLTMSEFKELVEGRKAAIHRRSNRTEDRGKPAAVV